MIDNTIAVKERHERFLRRVLETKIVWALDKGGETLAASDCSNEEHEGSRVVPFWSEKEYAEKCVKNDWADYVPKSFGLNEFLNGILPHLDETGFFAGTDWNSSFIGTELDPTALAAEIKKLMGKSERKGHP